MSWPRIPDNPVLFATALDHLVMHLIHLSIANQHNSMVDLVTIVTAVEAVIPSFSRGSGAHPSQDNIGRQVSQA